MFKNFGKLLLGLVLIGGILFLFTAKTIGENQKPLPEMKSTEKVVKIFQQNCAVSGCHKGAYPKKKLNLEKEKFFKAIVNRPSLQAEGYQLVDTKNPQKSYLLMKVRGDSGIVDAKMPVDAPPLKKAEIEEIEKWIISLKQAPPKKAKPLPGKAEKKKLERQ